jgi:hypothetical protein
MRELSLSEQFEGKGGFCGSNIDGKRFLPLDALEKLITKKNVNAELGAPNGAWANLTRSGKSSDPLDTVTKQAKKVFATLARMDKAHAIYGLLGEGLTDGHLPLVLDTDYGHLKSRDHEAQFPFEGWRHASLTDFLERQWLFLAPVLDVTGKLIKVDQQCALPFKESDYIGHGAAGVVYWAKVHEAHQKGFEVSDITYDCNSVESLKSSDGDSRP